MWSCLHDSFVALKWWCLEWSGCKKRFFRKDISFICLDYFDSHAFYLLIVVEFDNLGTHEVSSSILLLLLLHYHKSSFLFEWVWFENLVELFQSSMHLALHWVYFHRNAVMKQESEWKGPVGQNRNFLSRAVFLPGFAYTIIVIVFLLRGQLMLIRLLVFNFFINNLRLFWTEF